MKRHFLRIFAILAAVVAWAGCSANEVEVEPTMTPTATTTPTPEAEPALAICMNTLDHPVHRQVQLGFLDGCKELGYEDVSIIGAVDGDQKSQLDMALEWAKSVEGRPAAMLLWNGDHNSDELCEKLDEMGVYVGIPHFKIFVDDDYSALDEYENSGDSAAFEKVMLPAGINFEYRIDDYEAGRRAAQLMAKKLDGKKGSVICSVSTKGTSTNEPVAGFMDEFKRLKYSKEYDLSEITVQEYCMLGGEDIEWAQAAMGYYEEYGDLIGVFGYMSIDVIPWTTAFREKGVDPDDWVMITYDLTDSNIGRYESGEVDMLINQNYYFEGYKCAENFDKLFKGEKVPKFEYIEAEYLTEETADELLPKYKELFERTKDDEFFERYKAREFIAE